MSEIQWAKTFADAARELAGAGDSTQTLTAIAEVAIRIAGCEWAAIARAAKDATPVVAATSDTTSAERIAEIQASGGGGPTWAAVRECRTVAVDDVATETRWPAHIRRLRTDTPVRSLLAICLELDGDVLGALTLYADRPNAFPPAVRERVSVYIDHAVICLDRERISDHADNLERALDTNREIGVAIGILVERHKITTDQAFAMLRIASQHAHRKLHDVASDLVRTGEFADVTLGDL